jgi:thiol:disulfide interchange protein
VKSFILLLGLALGGWQSAGEARQAAAQQKPAKPAVYDEAADARADLKAALARAHKENKRVLVQWGANWCGWCVKLDDICKSDKEIARKILYEYEVVHVDIGKSDKNLDLVKELGATLGEGVPYLTVLDASGKPVAQQETGALEVKDEGRHDPAKVLGFLTSNQAPYLVAQELYDAALKRAQAEGKRVFLHFGAPWCGWCHRLEAWMADARVAAILSKDFIDLKIDEDRTVGGKELVAKMRGERKGGLPWIVFLDAQGKELAAGNDLDDPEQQNVGFPQADPEIAWFGKMLATSRNTISDAEIAELKASLAKVRDEREKAAAERKKAAGAGG